MDLYVKTGKQLRSNMSKAYALIYLTYCDSEMKSRIDKKVVLDATITNDPIKLLITIRTLMQEPVKEENAVWSFIQVNIKSMTIAQQPDESMTDYIKRFKQNRDFFKGVIKSDFMTGWLGDQPEYIALDGTVNQDADQTAMKNAQFSRMCATLLMYTADPAKYGSLTTGLKTQFNLGNDQWPKNTDAAAKLLANHVWDNAEAVAKKEGAQSRAASFAQGAHDTSGLTCNCCGVKGHISPECPKWLTIPPDKWHKPKVKKVLAQAEAVEDEVTDNEQQTESEPEPSSAEEESRSSRPRRSNTPKRRTTRTSRRGSSRRNDTTDGDSRWAAFEWSGPLDTCEDTQGAVFSGGPKWSTLLADKIILDTGSTIAGTIMNPDFVTNVQPASRPITMSTNAGSKRMTVEGTVPGFGPVYFDEPKWPTYSALAIWLTNIASLMIPPRRMPSVFTWIIEC